MLIGLTCKPANNCTIAQVDEYNYIFSTLDIVFEVKYVDKVESVEKLGLGYLPAKYLLQVTPDFDTSFYLGEAR